MVMHGRSEAVPHTGGSIMQKVLLAATTAMVLVWSQVNATTVVTDAVNEQIPTQHFSIAGYDWLSPDTVDDWRNLAARLPAEEELWLELQTIHDQYLEQYDWQHGDWSWAADICAGEYDRSANRAGQWQDFSSPDGCNIAGKLDQLVTRFESSPYYSEHFDGEDLRNWLQDRNHPWTNPDSQVVPIPPALALFGSALAGLGWQQRRKKVRK
jgi:hypothetical protein